MFRPLSRYGRVLADDQSGLVSADIKRSIQAINNLDLEDFDVKENSMQYLLNKDREIKVMMTQTLANYPELQVQAQEVYDLMKFKTNC